MGLWEKIGFIERSKYRKLVFLHLEKPIRPSQIAKKLNIRLTHITRAIRELKKEDIVFCLNPKVRVGRFYQLNDKGRRILKEIKKF